MIRRVCFASFAALVAVGCSGGTGSGEPGGLKTGTPVRGGLPEDSVEVVAFKGGYGIDKYEAAAKEFMEKNPTVKVEVSGNPRVWEQLRPRLVANTPPDLMFPGWGMDHWALVEEGQVLDLNPALDRPGPDGEGKWRDSFHPEIIKLGQQDGHTFMLPLYLMVYGWWFDPGLFKKHGWTPPKTYAELLELGPKIKAKGIAPITFQGQYPYYMMEMMFLPWAGYIGGKKALDDAQNLVPGAWNSSAMLQSATMIDELNRKGFFQEGAVGMSHTESQTQFLQGKAAMIPCGSWIRSEMKEVMPEGAQMEFFQPPAVAGAPTGHDLVFIGVEPWMVPSNGKNPDGAVELFKFMTSKEKATEFMRDKETLMAIQGLDESSIPESLLEQKRVVDGAKSFWANQYRQWYPAMQKAMEGALTAMLNREISPKEFVDRCEAAAEETRKDDSLKKYKVQ
jgi:N-acetylglucosamine transport system substrate-binding protein